MKRYRTYIWDFDGTLFDSYPHTTAALCAACGHFGIDATPERVNRLLRHNFATAFAELKLTPEQQAYFRALHGDKAFPPRVVPFDEAPETLRRLKSQGARHLLYTHSRRRMSVAFLEEFTLDGLFDGFMTPDDAGFTLKPDPGALLLLMSDHGVVPETAVMVGDREIDMRSAHAAGIDGILFDPDRLVKVTCAEARIDRLLELCGDIVSSHSSPSPS